MVLSGLVTAWRLAGCPTSRSPSSENATIDGVVRAPSAFSMTFGVLPSITATQEFVVPRSMPMTLPIVFPLVAADRTARRVVQPGPDSPAPIPKNTRPAALGRLRRSYRRAVSTRKIGAEDLPALTRNQPIWHGPREGPAGGRWVSAIGRA